VSLRAYIQNAYDDFRIPRRTYLTRYVAPPVILTFLFSLCIFLVFPGIFTNLIVYITIILFPFYILLALLLSPVAKFQSRKMDIDREMLLFMIRMSVLSEANVPKREMFDILSEMREFGELGVEISKIHKLVNTWNTNLGDACRIVSKRTPSHLFGDFLDRLAHAIDTGDDPRVFFMREQKAFKNNYEVEYRGMLFKIEILIELFIAIVIIATFFEFFVIILPFLNYANTSAYFIGVPFLFIFFEVVYLFFLQTTMPKENLRQDTGIRSSKDLKTISLLIVSFVLCLAFFLVLLLVSRTWFYDDTLMPVSVALIFTPLMIPGIFSTLHDKNILRTEDNFPAFIRSLGGSATSGGTGTLKALRKLKAHDFGPLTEHITTLYKRVNLNISSEKSWEHFGAETGSDLIAKFSRMYMLGVRAGGDNEGVSEIVSKNFLDITGLRKHRYIYASIFTMVIYGIALVVSFSLFISGDVTKEVADNYRGFEIPGAIEEAGIEKPEVYDDYVITLAFFCILFAHAIISGQIVRFVGSGSSSGTLVHVSGILWVGALMSVFSEYIISRVL